MDYIRGTICKPLSRLLKYDKAQINRFNRTGQAYSKRARPNRLERPCSMTGPDVLNHKSQRVQLINPHWNLSLTLGERVKMATQETFYCS